MTPLGASLKWLHTQLLPQLRAVLCDDQVGLNGRGAGGADVRVAGESKGVDGRAGSSGDGDGDECMGRDGDTAWRGDVPIAAGAGDSAGAAIVPVASDTDVYDDGTGGLGCADEVLTGAGQDILSVTAWASKLEYFVYQVPSPLAPPHPSLAFPPVHTCVCHRTHRCLLLCAWRRFAT